MIKHLILCALTAIAVFPQAQTPLTITQSAGSATGELRLQERRTNGQNYVGLKAPQSVATNTVWTLPDADGTSGQCLQTDGAGVMSWAACTATRYVDEYDWSQVIGARSGSGTLTLTFTGTSCPAAGADAQYVARVYETVTPTTYELGISDGTGTCTRGGSGTIVLTGITGTYTNATAASASSGWQEAMFSVADSLPVYLRARVGGYYIYSDILTEDRVASIECEGPGAILVPMDDNVKVFNIASPSAARIRGCKISNAYAHTGITAVYFDNPDGDTFGGLVEGLEIYDVENGIHGVTWYAIDAVGNLIVNPSNAAIWIENVSTGDAGAGVVERNKLSCSSTCTYGVLWNGPGAVEIKNNPINGFTNQVYLEPLHGYASAANSGADTIITHSSGNRFRAAMVGKEIHVGTAACTVTTYTSSTVLRCNGVNLGTISASRYYAGTSGQAQVIGNLLDGGNNTNYGVRWVGEISFTNAQIEDNFIANYAVNSAKGVSIEGSGLAIAAVKHNNIQGAPALTGTVGINATAGGQYHISDNQISGYQTALNIGGSVLYATIENNRCVSFGTVCAANAASTVVVRENGPLTFSQLPSSIADGSVIYCSDCKATSAASRTCAGSGTGATATRLNGAWKCEDGTPQSQWTVSGSDIYRVSKVGIGAAPVVGTQLSISGGSGVNTLYITDSTNAGIFQINAASSYTFIGSYSATPLIFGTDSTARWRLTSAGNFQPEADDAYDIGTSTVSPNAIYSHGFSAIATSSDYVRARKIEHHMDGTGAAFFSWSFASSNVLDLLDTSSGVIAKYDLNTSDISFAGHVWPRGTTETRNLGLITARWLAVNAKNLNLSGNVTSNLTPSGTRDLGASGSEWNGLYTGSAVVTSAIEPKVNGGASNGGSSKRWGAMYTVDLDVSGTCTGCGGSSLPVVDTTGISKGSSDASKILRFEVDGFTTATTRVLTPQNNSYTIAGTDISQTFSNTQTFSGIFAVSGTVGDDFIPNSDGAYVNGTTSARWGSIATYNADLNGVLTLQSGSTITGSVLPTTNNLYSLGNTSFRWSTVVTVNANISGTITAPSGSTGFSGTTTVRDSAGTGTCTLIYSGGIRTGGTC